MAVLVVAFAATLVSACKDEDLCGPFEVSEDGTSCVCPPPFEVSGDGLECVCPAGFVEEGDECLRLDGGAPVDASLPDATTPPGDGGADSCTPRTFYRDGDGDGRGTEDESQVACAAPPGFVDNADDCDDGCDSCWTDAEEACDGLDNDCDGGIDEGARRLVGAANRVTVDAPLGEGDVLDAAPMTGGRWLAAYSDPSGRLLTGILPTSLDSLDARELRIDSRLFVRVETVRATDRLGVQYSVASRTPDMRLVYSHGAFGVEADDGSLVDGSALSSSARVTESGDGFVAAWLEGGDLWFQPFLSDFSSAVAATRVATPDGQTVTSVLDVFSTESGAAALVVLSDAGRELAWVRLDPSPEWTTLGAVDAPYLVASALSPEDGQLILASASGEAAGAYDDLTVQRFSEEAMEMSLTLSDAPGSEWTRPELAIVGGETRVLSSELTATGVRASAFLVTRDHEVTRVDLSSRSAGSRVVALDDQRLLFSVTDDFGDGTADLAVAELGCPE